jgi:hypothetical protein
MSTDDHADPRGIQRNRPETVDALASTVISVLRGRQVVSCEGLRQFVLDHIMRAILSRGRFGPDALLAELRGYRLTVDAIIDLYVPRAARLLGEQWSDDRINFADVTIGIMRLQSLLAEAAQTVLAEAMNPVQTVHALVLVPQGEQHFLGASVLSSQIRRMGHDVDMSFDEDMGTLTARLMRDAPDVVLITSARRETLECVANTVQTIRGAVSDLPLVVVGGAVDMDGGDIISLTCADIVTSSADEAMAACVRHVRLRRSR